MTMNGNTCADDSVLPPYIVYKGNNFYLDRKQGGRQVVHNRQEFVMLGGVLEVSITI